MIPPEADAIPGKAAPAVTNVQVVRTKTPHNDGDRICFGDADDPYVMLDELGSGAMATVYKCYKRSQPDQKYAAKVISLRRLKLSHQSFNKEYQKLQREAQILASLRNKYITSLVDVTEQRDNLYLVGAGRTRILKKYVCGFHVLVTSESVVVNSSSLAGPRLRISKTPVLINHSHFRANIVGPAPAVCCAKTLMLEVLSLQRISCTMCGPFSRTISLYLDFCTPHHLSCTPPTCGGCPVRQNWKKIFVVSTSMARRPMPRVGWYYTAYAVCADGDAWRVQRPTFFSSSVGDGKLFPPKVMEMVPFGELFDRILEHDNEPYTARFSEPEARFIFVQISAGLKFVHSKQIVHRDLKPENILVVSRDLGFSNLNTKFCWQGNGAS